MTSSRTQGMTHLRTTSLKMTVWKPPSKFRNSAFPRRSFRVLPWAVAMTFTPLCEMLATALASLRVLISSTAITYINLHIFAWTSVSRMKFHGQHLCSHEGPCSGLAGLVKCRSPLMTALLTRNKGASNWIYKTCVCIPRMREWNWKLYTS